MASPDGQDQDSTISAMAILGTPFLCFPDLYQGFLPMPVGNLPNTAVYFSAVLRQNIAAGTRDPVINCGSQIKMLVQPRMYQIPLKLLQTYQILLTGLGNSAFCGLTPPPTSDMHFPCDLLRIICIPRKGLSLKLGLTKCFQTILQKLCPEQLRGFWMS